MKNELRDRRLPPFAWVSRAAIAQLRACFDGRERSTALSIYTALAILSSEQRRATHDGIVATRREIADVAGVSDRTIDAYGDRLCAAGLLELERRGEEGLPNLWTLVEPSQGGEAASPPVAAISGEGRNQEHPPETVKEEKKTDGAKAPSTEADLDREIFAYWQAQCHHSQAKPTSDRLAKIRSRRRDGYTQEQMMRAIDGAAIGAWVNEHGKRFDDLELILRNGSKLEDFIERANRAAPGGNVVDITTMQPESVRKANAYMQFYDENGAKEEYR